MKSIPRSRSRSERGAALVTAFIITMLLAVAGVEYVDHSTQALRISRRREAEIQTMNLCEAGAQELLLGLWLPFKSTQDYSQFDPSTQGASLNNPTASLQDSVPGVGSFASGVINVSSPDTYTRIITVRTVGWIDSNNNGVLDASEAFKTVDVTATFSLDRSKVFDYTYFVNNYGWMDGFGPNDLIVNGDMRANGDFRFTNGSPTVNGSVYACYNNKLAPIDTGLVNTPPVKWTDSQYQSSQGAADPNAAQNEQRWRQDYNPGTFGSAGSALYEANKDLTFMSTGLIDPTSGTVTGSILGDATGIKNWQETSVGSTPTETVLDTTPTQEVVMPDLSDLTTYQSLSSSYIDTNATFQDGTVNPNFNKGAYVEVWDTGTNAYNTVTISGNITGSAILIGTAAHPIIVHGPSTVSQDVLIKGVVSGQGTIYSGRNVHVIGSITYSDPPDFEGSDPTAIDNANSKADLLALAARGSVMMGNSAQFGWPYPLQYMTPPFTLGRYDDNGNWIPPFNAYATDSTGRMLYQSVVPDTIMNSLSENVNQIDAVLYTNFVGGGNIGTGSSGLQFNGSIISKNEAMVIWSLPMHENYDARIHERSLSQKPLIDVDLPRSPTLLTSVWQDRGFAWSGE